MTAEMKLSGLKRGERAVVAALPLDEGQLRKLMAFGILPGVEIEVRQTFPGFVLSVGHTLLAVDREIAGAILVRK